MNKIILSGYIVRDPITTQILDNIPVSYMTLAVKRKQTHDISVDTDFIEFKTYGKLGTINNQYIRKGSHVAIEGHIKTYQYTNADNQKVYTTEIIAEKIEFLGNTQKQDDQETIIKVKGKVKV